MFRLLILSLLSLIFSTLNSYSQGWVRLYKTDTLEYGNDPRSIIEADGLGYFMLTGTENGSVLFRVDNNGKTLWSKDLKLDVYAEMTKTQGDDLIIYSKKGYISDSFKMTRLDGRGNLIWQKSYAHTASVEFVNKLVTTTEGNPVIVFKGNDSTVTPVAQFSRVICFDNKNGNIRWTKSYSKESVVGTLARTNNEILLLTRDTTQSIRYGNGKMLWLDGAGNLTREKLLDSVPFANQLIGHLSFNKFYLFFPIGSESVFRSFDNEGNVIQRLVKTQLNNTNLRYVLSKDGSIIAINNTIVIDNVSWRIFNYNKLDLNGKTIFSKEYYRRLFGQDGNYGTFILANEVIATRDNGVLISTFQRDLKKRILDTIDVESAVLIKLSSDGTIYSNHIVGNISLDKNNNCLPDVNESKAKQWGVKAQKADGTVFWGTIDTLGQFDINVDTGAFMISGVSPSSYWQNCTPLINRNLTSFYVRDTANLVVKPTVSCPAMYVDISTQFLRRCFPNDFNIRYCNQGTATAAKARIEIQLDSLLEYVSATRPLSIRRGQTLIFDLGDVPSLDCGNFSITTKTRCGDSTRLGQTLCTTAKIFPDTVCSPPSNWSGANLIVNGRCDRDSVRFFVKNTSAVPTTVLKSIIVEDEIVFMRDNRSIAPNGTRIITLPANGKTWRINQEQEPNNPRNTTISAVIEGCRLGNGGFSTGFVNDFPNATGDPSVSFSCMPIVGSFDPNEKLAFPEGFKNEHFIDQNTAIDYQIGFQNTGTDTAFTVILRDTLNDNLDISTLKMGSASHKYSWDLVGKNVLTVTFNDINLVDSFKNEPASHGFVKFRINQKKDVALGTRIENKAAIYFDFNAPIFTNKTFHVVGTSLLRVSVDDVGEDKVAIKVYPNPFLNQATFELPPSVSEGIFELFDLTGKVLRREKFEGNVYEFYKKELSSGIFIFKITTANGRLLGNGKIVAQ
jgi:PQQ-like domain